MRILFAEDEHSLSRAICAILKKRCYEVDAVFDGRTALEYLTAGEYDGAILDIMMPGMNGLEVLRQARTAGVRTPVLLLTARSEVADKVEGLDSGANDYLTKPFDVQELLARIRAMTRSVAQPDSRLICGNTTLDSSTLELSTRSGSYRLTGKEYQMMEMLMRDPGRVIPTGQFLERIWGCETDAEIHVVWVYISYLRKKLAQLHADISIRALRGTGYALEVRK